MKYSIDELDKLLEYAVNAEYGAPMSEGVVAFIRANPTGEQEGTICTKEGFINAVNKMKELALGRQLHLHKLKQRLKDD